MTNQTYCNESCKREFTPELQTIPMGEGIEKVYFLCPHCQHEYVAFYTDAEIRGLQEQIRIVDQTVARMSGRTAKVYTAAASKRHTKLRKEIADKMSALRERVEADVLLQ